MSTDSGFSSFLTRTPTPSTIIPFFSFEWGKGENRNLKNPAKTCFFLRELKEVKYLGLKLAFLRDNLGTSID